MQKKAICRYCGRDIDPRPGKPGRIDECEPCLHDRTTPKRSDPVPRAIDRETKKQIAKNVRNIEKLRRHDGFSEEFWKNYDRFLEILRQEGIL
jgi:hypothetical protein